MTPSRNLWPTHQALIHLPSLPFEPTLLGHLSVFRVLNQQLLDGLRSTNVSNNLRDSLLNKSSKFTVASQAMVLLTTVGDKSNSSFNHQKLIVIFIPKHPFTSAKIVECFVSENGSNIGVSVDTPALLASALSAILSL